MRDVLVNVFFRLWYKVVCFVDKKSQVTFMNYGFSSKGHDISWSLLICPIFIRPNCIIIWLLKLIFQGKV